MTAPLDLMSHDAFGPLEKRKELWGHLSTGSTLNISEDKIDKRPSVVWSLLVDRDSMRAFLSAMEWVVRELTVGSKVTNS